MKKLLISILCLLGSQLHSFAQTNLVNMNYEVKNLPFNTKEAAFSPTLVGNKLYFCHSNKQFSLGEKPAEMPNTNLYVVSVLGSKYSKPQKVKSEINSNLPENATVIRGKKMILTRSRQANHKQEPVWALYESQYQYSKWSRPLLVFNKPIHNIAYPALSPDGQVLYFAADLNGGYGGMDLYMSQRIGEAWSKPINLGDKINTPKNEIYPTMSADGTLFFASNSALSLGGYDIYYSRLINGQWDIANRLPEPINSKADDFSLVMASATTGYFSSNRISENSKKNTPNYDIYGFSMNEIQHDTPDTEPAISRTESGNNALFVKSFDYSLLQKDNKINAALGLHPIRFAPQDSRILPQTQMDLDKVVYFMQQNPNIILKVDAHTETRGDADANLQLSTRRANAIKNYFQTKLIPTERIVAYGSGEKFPINYCKEGINCPPEKHDENNRVDFAIVSGSIAPQIFAWETGRSNNTARSINNNDNEQPPIRQVVLREEDMVADANHPIYKVALGPFVTLDNRLFFDHNLSPNNVKIETTPKGKVIIVGKYQTAQEANQRRAELDRLSGHKAATVLIETVSPPLSKSKTQRRDGYEVLIGPFKHVDTETFHKLAAINSRARIQYMPEKGSMIVFSNFNSAEEANQCKHSLWNVLPRKTEAIIMTIDGKILSSEKKK
jgi:outer membrane protein OmpA-like peptidoglycan-associated protein